MTRLVVLSDTHGFHDRLVVPDGDVVVHAGDFCDSGSEAEARSFAAYFLALPHRHKVLVAGNHDRCLERDADLGERLFPGCHYLLDRGVELAGLRFWGAPWQPWFFDWAFNLPRGEPLRAKWALIPAGVDVLVTHGPPYGVLDRVTSGALQGCEELALAIDRVRPRLHLFGHIHESYGWERRAGTLHVNASSCGVRYASVNPVRVVDVPADGPAVVRR
jgi:predicted phosphodiesterase